MPEKLQGEASEPTSDEKRPATPPPLADHLDADDRCAVVVPTTAELPPLPTDGSMTASALQRLLEDAVDGLQRADDWTKQYESVTTARRVVVFASWLGPTLPSPLVTALVARLTLASDNLRSALVRNALLALAECFARLPRALLERQLETDAGHALVDVLLRRCVCEKRFLRDAALQAAASLSTHLAGVALMASAALFAGSKNARLCGHAAGLIASSLEQLAQQRGAAGGPLPPPPPRVFRALAALRDGKDAAARAQAAASFKLLASLLGSDQFASGLAAALGSPASHAVARIVKEACAASGAGAAEPPARRESLRGRMLLESRSKAC